MTTSIQNTFKAAFSGLSSEHLPDSLQCIRILQAEARAEFAERSVQKLQKEVDRLEGAFVIWFIFKQIISVTNRWLTGIRKTILQFYIYNNICLLNAQFL